MTRMELTSYLTLDFSIGRILLRQMRCGQQTLCRCGLLLRTGGGDELGMFRVILDPPLFVYDDIGSVMSFALERGTNQISRSEGIALQYSWADGS